MGSWQVLRPGRRFFGEKRLLHFLFLTMRSPGGAQAGLWLLAAGMDVADATAMGRVTKEGVSLPMAILEEQPSPFPMAELGNEIS